MQLPDRAELAGFQLVRGEREGHRLDDGPLVDLLTRRRVVEDIHVGVLVTVRHVLAVHARQEPHGQHFRLEHALARAQDADVDETNRSARNRLQPGIADHRAQIRKRRGLSVAGASERQGEQGEDEHAEGRPFDGAALPKAAAQPAESRQTSTGTEQDERARLGRGLPRVVVGEIRVQIAQKGTSVEEQLGVVTELVKATIFEIGEHEASADLLVGAQAAAERVEQGERDVIRAGADVVCVIQRAGEDVAEDAARHLIVDLERIGPRREERRPRRVQIVVGATRGADDVRVEQRDERARCERRGGRVANDDADAAQVVGVEGVGDVDDEALADEVRVGTTAQVVGTDDQVLLERGASVDRRVDGRRPEIQAELINVDGQRPGGGRLHDEHQREAEPDEKSRPQAHTRRTHPSKHMAALLLNGLVLLGGKPFATLVPSPKDMEDRVFFPSASHRRNLRRQ